MHERAQPKSGSRPRAAAAAVLAVALVAWLVVYGAAPAPAQVDPDPNATTTTSTTEPPPVLPTTTTAPPPSTTTTQPPPPPGPGPAPTPAASAATDNEAPAEVPQDQVVIPPADPSLAPDPSAAVLQQIAGLTLAEATKGLKAAQISRLFAAAQTSTLTGEVADLESRLNKLEGEKAQSIARLQQARVQMKKRAVAGYMGSPASPISQILEASDFNDLARRFELLQAVIRSDRARIGEYDAAREAAGHELEGIVALLDAKRSALAVAGTVLDGADSALLAKQIMVAAVKAGGDVVGGGFVFPVGGPHSFSDTFGAPRLFGTPYFHLHEGTDVFAAPGTPLLAVERGVLIRVGTDILGGTKLWLVGASGTRYYYAHLSAFAEGVVENLPVKAGDPVGFVGDTGDAQGGATHLHFEVHPGGGPAVNPYPLLKIVDDAQKKLAASQPQPRPQPTGPKS